MWLNRLGTMIILSSYLQIPVLFYLNGYKIILAGLIVDNKKTYKRWGGGRFCFVVG